MELHGSIGDNLRAAVQSSKRLEGHPIYTDTLGHWSDLISAARALRAAGELRDDGEVEQLIAELEAVLAQHGCQ